MALLPALQGRRPKTASSTTRRQVRLCAAGGASCHAAALGHSAGRVLAVAGSVGGPAGVAADWGTAGAELTLHVNPSPCSSCNQPPCKSSRVFSGQVLLTVERVGLAAGYYLHATSGYYYDANTGLYYNSQLQQWMAYDAATGTYTAIPAGTEFTRAARQSTRGQAAQEA